MEQRQPMSPEQLQALRNQIAGSNTPQQVSRPPEHQALPPQQSYQQYNSEQQNHYAAPQSTVLQQSMPQPPKMTAQEAMMARMEASRNKAASTQSVMQQGEQYNPVNQTSAQPSSPVANQTIINTTQGAGGNTNPPAGKDSGDSGDSSVSKGFKMNPVMAIAMVIAVLLVAFFGYSSISKHKTDADGEETSEPSLDPFEDPDLEWIIPGSQWEYTPEQIAQLRAAGYTGTEIEQYAQTMTPYTDLIKRAEAARDAYIQEAIAPLYDTASDEYKRFISQTWLSLEKRVDIYEWKTTAMNYSRRENLDYEKVDVYGNQLFIKIYLDDFDHSDWFYCLVTPDEWNKLKNAGNIIVNYTYSTRIVGDDPMNFYEDTDNFYIISSSIEFVE